MSSSHLTSRATTPEISLFRLKQAYSLLLALAACFCSPLFAQASPQDVSSQPEEGLRVPLFHPDEFAFESGLEYYAPQPGFNRRNRDIDIALADVALTARLRSGWEFLLGGFAFRANGTRTAASLAANPPQVASSAVGLGAGPIVRWNFLQVGRLRLFLDSGGSLLFADRPFPQHGSVYDFLLRAGGGVSLDVSDSYWVESAFHFAHISNGQGFDSANPTWQGNGVSLGIRRVFGRKEQASEPHGGPLLKIFGKADEGAWVTGAEYYAPLPGFAHRGANFQGDIRALRISRAWHFPNRVELQLGGMVQKTDSATGLGALLRWNFFERGHVRLFADGGADFLQVGSPAYIIPSSGDGYTGFFRAGGGASWRLHGSYWVETGFRWAHVPEGFGSGASQYPQWSGQGASISLRHVF